ncbi:hypothetical protein EYF80_031024 [Liparis tanakae]|uniref:Uncharacterized protein n=1 Tax=Liparis tanakae TaxID=230148 RepID=A0A4Z2GZ72_9TELE|nr:hypothetical protein EYF80_031024 [Liparis tanakae]
MERAPSIDFYAEPHWGNGKRHARQRVSSDVFLDGEGRPFRPAHVAHTDPVPARRNRPFPGSSFAVYRST